MAKDNTITEETVSRRTLKDFLMDSTKEMLLRTAHIFGTRVRTSYKKEAIADAIEGSIFSNPRKFLEGLTIPELDIVKAICSANENQAVHAPLMERQMSLYQLGILFMFDRIDIEGLEMYDLPSDLKQALKGYVENVIKEKRKGEESNLETVVLGYLNLFGVIGIEPFIKFLADKLKITKDEVEDYLRSRYLLRGRTFEFNGNIELISSPFFDFRDLESLIATADKYKEILYYFDAPLEMVVQWGMMPFPVEHAPYAKKLLALLRKKTKRAGLAEAALTRYWTTSQLTTNPTDAISEFLHFVNFKDMNEAQKVMEQVMAFNNKMPRWIFRGHSSEEVSKMNFDKTPKLRIAHLQMGDKGIGGNNRFEDIDNDDDFEALLYKGINPNTGKKIRPNDLCPCGSGLKYKKCHGRLPN